MAFILALIMSVAWADTKTPILQIPLHPNPAQFIHAADLVCQKDSCGPLKDQPLIPDQVQSLINQHVVPDDSALDPIGSSIIWSNHLQDSPYKTLWTNTLGYPVQTIDANELHLHKNGESFQYISYQLDTYGNVSLSVSQNAGNNVNLYNIRLSPKAHNVLLLKSLLRKIGYFVPPIERLANFTVDFSHMSDPYLEERQFIDSIWNQTLISPAQWIRNIDADTASCISNPPSDPLSTDPDAERAAKEKAKAICADKLSHLPPVLQLRDGLVFGNSNDIAYNFARGEMVQSVIQGRRLFNALLVPFNLTDVNPDINRFSWVPGQVVDQFLMLPYRDAEEFLPNIYDLKWIMRRIAKLSRNDWQDIVNSAELPDGYSQLLVEKLIARRNWLVRTLGLTEFSQLPVNPKLNYGDVVKDGQLQRDICQEDQLAMICWQANPDSPITKKEIFALARSKTFSAVIANLVSQFNSRYMPNTNVAKKAFDHELDVLVHNFEGFIKTGEQQKIPFGIYSIPYFDGNVIASRDIIIGSYLGADNTMQLADTIGISMSAGKFIGTDGMPKNRLLSGDFHGFYVNTYTHIKPTLSIEAARKTPLKDMIVPLLKRNGGLALDDLLQENLVPEIVKESDPGLDVGALKKEIAIRESGGDVSDPLICRHATITHPFDVACIDIIQQKISTVLKKFTDELGVGESLIVETNIGENFSISPTANLSATLTAQLQFNQQLNSVSRIHIFRKDDNTIQIFKSPAKYCVVGLDLSLSDYIPILDIGSQWTNGWANTDFFTINIDPKLDENPGLFSSIRVLREAMLYGDVTPMEQPKPTQMPDPYFHHVIKHKFGQREHMFDFLWFKHLGQNINDSVAVTTPENFTKHLLMRSRGTRNGIDYQDVAFKVINYLIANHFRNDISIPNITNGNPADTIFGHAHSHRVVVEGSVGNSGGLAEPYVRIEHLWRGWSISHNSLLGIIDDQENRLHAHFFDDNQLKDTKKVQLYALDIQLNIYTESLEELAGLSDNQIAAIFYKYGQFPKIPDGSTDGVCKPCEVNDLQQQESNDSLVRSAVYAHRNFARYAGTDANRAADALIDFMNRADTLLSVDGLYALFGQDGFYITSALDGFKVGDPNGLKTVYGDTIGQINGVREQGPFQAMATALGINPSEFYLYWILDKL